jgi:hypothetical protein
MSKNYNKPSVKKTSDREREFTNSAGLVIKIHGLPPLEIPRLAADIEYPSVPTYTVTTATGDTETHQHDETSLTSPEDKIAWQDYKDKFKAAEAELTTRILKCVLIEAVEVEITDLEGWSKRQKLMGMPVSEDPEERMLHYKETQVIRSPEDISEVMRIAMELTGVSEEAIKAAKTSFQGGVESST